MSTTTYVFVEKSKRYQHFLDEKSALSVAMEKVLQHCIDPDKAPLD